MKSPLNFLSVVFLCNHFPKGYLPWFHCCCKVFFFLLPHSIMVYLCPPEVPLAFLWAFSNLLCSDGLEKIIVNPGWPLGGNSDFLASWEISTQVWACMKTPLSLLFTSSCTSNGETAQAHICMESHIWGALFCKISPAVILLWSWMKKYEPTGRWSLKWLRSRLCFTMRNTSVVIPEEDLPHQTLWCIASMPRARYRRLNNFMQLIDWDERKNGLYQGCQT